MKIEDFIDQQLNFQLLITENWGVNLRMYR